MISLTLRFAKGAALVVTLGLVASCGLPRSGPNKAEIFSASVMERKRCKGPINLDFPNCVEPKAELFEQENQFSRIRITQ